MKAMIPTREFELRKAQAAATLAAIPGAAILVAATRAVILEAIPAEVIRTQGKEVEHPTGDDKIPGLKTTPKCSR